MGKSRHNTTAAVALLIGVIEPDHRKKVTEFVPSLRILRLAIFSSDPGWPPQKLQLQRHGLGTCAYSNFIGVSASDSGGGRRSFASSPLRRSASTQRLPQ